MDATIEDYQKLKAKYEKLKQKHKYVLKNYNNDLKHITELESEILDINTRTMQEIKINNNRFINN